MCSSLETKKRQRSDCRPIGRIYRQTDKGKRDAKAYRVGLCLGVHGNQQRLQTRRELERFDRDLEEVVDGADGGRHLAEVAHKTAREKTERD